MMGIKTISKEEDMDRLRRMLFPMVKLDEGSTEELSKEISKLMSRMDKEYMKGVHDGKLGVSILFHDGKMVDLAPSWIPCSERLPETDEVVLITLNNPRFRLDEPNHIEFGTYEEGRWWWLYESGHDYWEEIDPSEVIAWMPIPEPRREENWKWIK